MNMKKTIAALAAGAVAVSAMATSVSALESKTLNYNLKAAVKKITTGTVNITADFGDIAVATNGLSVAFDAKSCAADWIGNGKFDINSITVKLTDKVTNKTVTYVGAASAASDNYVAKVAEGTYAIPANQITAATYDVAVTINVNHNFPQDWMGLEVVNNLINGKTVDISVDGGAAFTKGTPKASGCTSTAISYVYAPMKTDIVDNYNVMEYLQTAMVNGNDKSYINVKAVLNDAIATYEGVTFTFNTAKENIDFAVVNYTDATNKVLKTIVADNLKTRAAANAKINEEKGKADVEVAKKQIAYDTADTAFKADTTNTEHKAWAEATQAVKDAVKGNDAAVYDKMVTADKELTTAKETQAKWANAKILPMYPTDSWKGTDGFKKFPEHTYNDLSGTGLFKGEGTDMMGFDWTGVNLFGGALVVNEAYTMSLADVCFFDLAGTTISFDWDAIMAETTTDNDWATYLNSLKLCTSTEWYWDSLDVVLTAAAAEDAPSVDDQSNADGDGADIPEDEGDDDADDDAEINTDDADDDDDAEINMDDADDDAAADDADDEAEATAPEASNPETGNAPVALAVIPVALAAAAVVAKKRS